MSKQEETSKNLSNIALAATKGAGALLVVIATVLSISKKRGSK